MNNANAVLNMQNPQIYDAMGIGGNSLAGDIELMRSKLMVGRVLAQMPLDVTYYAQGNVLDYELYKQTPFEVQFELNDSNFYGVPVYLNFLSEQRVHMHFSSGAEQIDGIFNIGQWYTFKSARINVRILDYNLIEIQQRKIKQDPFYFYVNNPVNLIDRYYNEFGITVTNQFAQTVKISFKDYNSAKTADFVNTMAAEYDEYDKESKSAGANNSLQFINETITAIDSELKDSEAKLEIFKRANKITDPVQNAKDVLEHINVLVDQRVELQLGSAILNRLDRDVRTNQKVDQLLPLLAGTFTDDLVKSLVERIQALEDKRANMRFSATMENSAIKSIDLEISRQRNMLMNAIDNAKKSHLEKLNSIDDRINEFEGDFSRLPGKEAEMARLERFYQVNQKFYQLLLEKKIEFSITRAGIVTNNIILQKVEFLSLLFLRIVD
ncbi:MAG: hypothetical protein IPP51_12570 [Bacteroidetes bacterium]|nr:hypothetical protein [Bacteroidota bacterium]